MPHDDLKIGDLARATGTKVVTIRYYEKIGLLAAPDRSAGNYRSYDAAALARLRFIRRSRDLGFSLDRIRELLELSWTWRARATTWTRSPRRIWPMSSARLQTFNRWRANCAGSRRPATAVARSRTVASSTRSPD